MFMKLKTTRNQIKSVHTITLDTFKNILGYYNQHKFLTNNIKTLISKNIKTLISKKLFGEHNIGKMFYVYK